MARDLHHGKDLVRQASLFDPDADLRCAWWTTFSPFEGEVETRSHIYSPGSRRRRKGSVVEGLGLTLCGRIVPEGADTGPVVWDLVCEACRKGYRLRKSR